ncbi:MAG TPA: glycosyltransferase [Sphingomicrobium sp.]|jgi:cellulose synthase/poly-beta-1,6-N-acetylglucosamine synthase-like glycosyltransferase/spore germination protein YaaH/peptidoglycan/xylan/chitin deacetylase (PgdA/CDA1 family)|nr:glycosyltransferase [Sphingomicrobium sp.]
MADRQIFHDPSGRRQKRFRIAVALFILLNVLSISALFATIGVLPAEPPLPVALEHGVARQIPKSSLLARATKRVDNTIARLLGLKPPSARQVGAKKAAVAASALNKPIYVGFYVPWDESSTFSLQRHINELDWLAPVWVTVTGPKHNFNVIPDRNGRAVINGAQHRPLILPVVQNFSNGQVDKAGAEALLADPAARRKFLTQLEGFIAANHGSGAVFDFEDLDRVDQVNYLFLLRAARADFARHNWLVTVAVPVDEGWDYRRFSLLADKLFLMAYDEHSNDGPPGPIASQQWWATAVAFAVRQIPRDKLIVAIGNYAYDWHDGTGDPDNVEEAWVDAGDSDAPVTFDRVSGNSTFAYSDENGHPHTVWLLDAASAYDQLTILYRVGIREVALWRLGAEDPGLWSIFGRSVSGPPNPAGLQHLAQGTNVDIEGAGEILRITALPTPGIRKLTLQKNGLLADVDFIQVPRPYTITRTGYHPGLVALTFDDGPDPRWTPKILDILKAKQVPATFFVVGENALTERDLLNRMISQGDEIGSHTYTHPNLATAGKTQTLFELNATQRLFQAFTGRTLKLFRAPFFGDAEPTTTDEVIPVLAAQNRGYISVGLHVDSEDWQRPGVPAIINNVISRIASAPPNCNSESADAQCSRNVVLLHDSGGDRSETVAALPIIIDTLRARGYRFVPVSELAGLSPMQAMPPLSPSDHTAAEIDLGMFELLSFSVRALGVLFTVAITLGIGRALVLSSLALASAWRERRSQVPPQHPGTFVSVLIPAFNEERVIQRCIAQVLSSENVKLEVIVIDDGSSDRTGEVVKEAYGNEPRVRLLQLENGGKARALNHGLAVAKSDLVIALDADTQFEPETISRLARWLVADEGLAAVAGNAKVGNRINIVTRWQALEYVTAQNVERRALAWLGAMTVVPGAVGAWRKQAIVDVGGYPPETLAEDQDLTIAVQRAGWRVTYDQSALAWTEAPQSFRQLARQRFRWAFGTIQCVWKHKHVMRTGKPRGLAFIGLPQTILFQLLFALVSPIIDLALVVNIVSTVTSIHEHGYTAVQGDLQTVAFFWILFAAIDLTAGLIAMALERRENWGLMAWLIPQRFGYRQIMYYVVIKAFIQAVRGPRVGWSTVSRSGEARIGARKGKAS